MSIVGKGNVGSVIVKVIDNVIFFESGVLSIVLLGVDGNGG